MNTVDQSEIQNFSKDSAQWWDTKGPFAVLHRLNHVRLQYVKNQICDHYDRDPDGFDSYQGLKILDIGCGGGLVCEPMARLGAKVTGIDADIRAIEVAKHHADESELKIIYRSDTTDILVKEKKQFDVVLALEVIEHVADPAQFVTEVLQLCKPGGLVIFSTLNRNPKSYALGIVAAEHILGWVPRGTHSWKKFVKPFELSRMVRACGGRPTDLCGLAFNPLKNEFHLAPKDLDVNYFMSVQKPSA
ncbi:MAG: bifunctional 2-polyprenyl-6-hydroxyphenol methylase/3-demethylubiquinol 3-O-methyltransferase UbiG [Alphaproteobacteria bacterium]|nr:bifunctional 2-polyprenyl-6-hydroxyphenol methylase/3-demethylubiquinol 3-O-methyltransferase UbiG [Alphaproteobacteria bacterium]